MLADMIAQLRQSSMLEARAPESLRATLRPYQQRGLSWLSTMGALGLGACLADDMGLGKTIQFLAFLLWRMKEMPQDPRPALLIAPTSVVGNWERETARFAPTLQVHAHHGLDRAKTNDDFPARSGSLVITTYGLLRRDAELLSKIDWSVVALDEAQNIKNASSTTAKAARSLRASQRFALTGTPVENRLAELWSILEFVNPGLLGPLEVFRRDFAVPIERYGNEKAAERLRRMVSPFILRRLKSDPNVVQDLPAKNEMKVICTLTKEQASLYKAVVDAELKRIEDSEGIQRRGRVLALLMATKQICNHPAQYLRESGPLPKRSGKLARLSEMLDEALAAGDKALVFTQFREMGERLVPHLETQLGCEVLFLHGGTQQITVGPILFTSHYLRWKNFSKCADHCCSCITLGVKLQNLLEARYCSRKLINERAFLPMEHYAKKSPAEPVLSPRKHALTDDGSNPSRPAQDIEAFPIHCQKCGPLPSFEFASC